jgi:hypothetical protein
VKYHAVLGWIQSNLIQVIWTNSGSQLADIMTKALNPAQFNRIIGLILTIFLHGTVDAIYSTFVDTSNKNVSFYSKIGINWSSQKQ